MLSPPGAGSSGAETLKPWGKLHLAGSAKLLGATSSCHSASLDLGSAFPLFCRQLCPGAAKGLAGRNHVIFSS